MMKNNKNVNNRKSRVYKTERVSKQDNALMLRPEYKGQPAISIKMRAFPYMLTTSVTSGIVSANVSLSKGNLNNFATNFAGFAEFRIVKVKASIKNYSSQSTGIGCVWFSEDDSSAVTVANALQAQCKQWNFSNVVNSTDMSYVPHDPAQQTWTLVSSGNPVIGYFKVWADNANFGTTIVATPLGIVTFEYTVQFRGLI